MAGTSRILRVGLVSDTHGSFHPALRALLRGCDRILHAGDVGDPFILAELDFWAPLTAVRGNVDGADLGGLPEVAVVRLGDLTALVIHDAGAPEGSATAVARAIERERPDLVVHGHSHQPSARRVGGILCVNPGSAGPKRFHLPQSAGRLEIDGRRVRVELLDLAAVPPGFLEPPLELDL